MVITSNPQEWANHAIADFEASKLYGHIVIEFRAGVAVMAEKKVATKFEQVWPTSTPNGANHARARR